MRQVDWNRRVIRAEEVSLTKLAEEVGASKTLLIQDETALKLHGPALADVPVYQFAASEATKTLASVEKIWDFLYANEADRDALLAVAGGGITLDVGAFAASVWKRGIRFLLVPTTLLAQTDAALGGKTGVNFSNAKNLVGSFAVPEFIYIRPQYLETLEQRTLMAGYAEALKHGLVADRSYWTRLQLLPETQEEWSNLVHKSLSVKASIVGADPLERGERQKLNFGHTVAHALEAVAARNGADLLHGEAVAAGLIAEARLSTKFANLAPTEAEEIKTVVAGLSYELPPLTASRDEVLGFLRQDKKRTGGAARAALLNEIGAAEINVAVPYDEILTSMNEMIAYES